MAQSPATKSDLDILKSRLRSFVAKVRTQIIAATTALLLANGVIQHFWH